MTKAAHTPRGPGRSTGPAGGGTPFVSVIMPIRNEAGSISESLGAVLRQDFPKDRMEILVADGFSTDGTRDVVATLQRSHPHLTLVDNPGRVVATGLNAAIRRARGDIIVRVDGHTIVAENYVSSCVSALETSGADNVGGRMEAVGRGAFGEAVALATSSRFGVGGARFHYARGQEWVDTVYMGAWRRSTLDRIGLFDERFVRNQDDELNYRLLDGGGRILLSPDIRSRYTVRGNPGSLWRQYFQYGFWKVRVLLKHPRQIRLRQAVPPLFVAGLLLTAALAPAIPAARVAVAAIAGSYALACAAACLRIASRGGRRAVLYLPVAFAILHLAYGAGFLIGVLGSWLRRPPGATEPGPAGRAPEAGR